MRRTIHIAVIVCVSAATALIGATNINPYQKWGWGENIGWTNWRDANGGNEGVHIGVTFLSGYIWGENVGWINVGDGTPAGGTYYANINGTDFGVNIDVNDDLYGLAWGENIGWINFDTRSKGAQRARADRVANRLRGYVWGENVGWVNLDDATDYVGFMECTCGDIDESGGPIDLNDFVAFANCFGKLPTSSPECLCSDLDGSGVIDLNDFVIFSNLFKKTSTKYPPNCP